MNLFLKIILGIVALAVVASVFFYIWLVIAYTPPKGPANPAQEGIVKQGVSGKVYFGIGWRDGEKGKIYTVTAGPATDDMSGEDVLRVTGTPVPIDVIAESSDQIEIIFDGKLADGSTSLAIAVDSHIRAKHLVEVENGSVKKAD